jgi:TM2 domain-containing membrane protein YozV
MKDKGTAYLWWFFTCFIGGHSFYLGRQWKGLFQAFTLGGFIIWALIDFFTIPYQVKRHNKKYLEQFDNQASKK